MGSNKYGLTFPQNNIYMIEKFSDNSPINTIAGIFKIESKFNKDICNRAVNMLIEKNDALRIKIHEEAGAAYQTVDDYIYKETEFIDMSGKSDEEIKTYMYSCVEIPLNFIDNKLYEFKVIRQENDKGYIFMKLHHIVSDAWTLGQMINQLVKFFNNELNNTDEEINAPSYLDFITSEKEYISSEKHIKDEQFWKEYLEDIKEPVSLKDEISKVSIKAKRYSVKLSEELHAKIMDYTKTNKMSPYALFLAALSTYIYRVRNADDFILGTPILNRSNFKEKQMVGMFVSVIPIRMKLEDNTKFFDLVKNTGLETMNLFRHQKYPIVKTLENIHSNTDLKGQIYNIIISYQNARSNIVNSESFSTEWLFNGNIQEDLQIHIMDMDNEGVLNINYDYKSDLFDITEIKYLHERIMAIIEDGINNIDVNIKDIRIMGQHEENKVLYEFNNTTIDDYPKNMTIVDLFEKQAKKTPDNVALVFEDKQMTYREFNDKSNQLANFLRFEKRIARNDVVAILNKRGFEMIISIFGIIKAGAAYLPIDPEYPQERINYMIKNSDSKLVITDMENINISSNVINLNDFNYSKYETSNLEKTNEIEDLIYIMYTSGSTGLPKATMIKHENVVNYIESVKRYMDYTATKNVISITTMSFDIFVFELFPTLCLGLSLFIANEKEQKFPEELIQFIYLNKIEKICTTPSRIQSILEVCKDDEKLRSIKEYNLGGEPITNKILDKIKSRFNVTVFNCYGPTETTVYSTFKNLTNTDKINIGKPINNTQVYILDRYNKPVPIGIDGEISIGGIGVGKGYYKQEELTKQKYIDNNITKFGGKIYLTGDIGRWNNEGELECLGRNDNQVKINGKRVELPEISKNISSFENVKEAVVKVIDNGNMNYLCAYIVGQSVDIDKLKDYLSVRLPKYMIPISYVFIDKMPLSHNGKIDIKKLPLPKINSNNRDYIEPKTKTEKDICKVISQYANIEKVSVEDNLFDIGIDSLTIIKVQVALFSMGYSFSTQDFYNYPKVSLLARLTNSVKRKIKLENKENRLITFNNNDFTNINLKKKSKVSNILLTGATGFLGIHVLKELLSKTKTNIYCIVRKKQSDPTLRLLDKLKYYFGIRHISSRIHILEGDLTEGNFGLTDEQYKMLENNIDEIIHVAANVKYYGNYEDFEKNNILSTENVVKLALKNNKVMNYVSSLGVSGHYLVDHEHKDSIFSEDHLFIGQNYEQNYYVKSKYLVEQNLYNYHDNKNLKLRVFRVGNLTGRFSDGKFQENQNENAFYNILRSILKLKAIPTSMLSNSIDFSPVDVVAKAMVKIIKLEDTINHTYHIGNNSITTTKEIVELMNKTGENVAIMSEEEFAKYAQQISHLKDKADALDGLINDINEDKRLMFNAGVNIKSVKSNDLLKKLGIKFKRLDKRYFKKVVYSIRK